MATREAGQGGKLNLGWVSLLALCLAGIFASLQVSTWPARLSYPGEQSDIEGMRLAEMVHLRRGIRIYALPSGERFDASIYGPLYYLMGAQLVDPAEPDARLLRIVSMLATLGLATGCGLLAFWLTRSGLAASLAPLLFLSYAFVSRHGTSGRSDMVAVTFAFIGFLVAFRYQHNRRVFLAVPFILLGFFFKQQFVAGPAAMCVFLILERRFWLAAQFAALLAGGGLAALAIFQWVIFRGQSFFEHFLLYNVTPFSWVQFKYAGLMFFILVLSVPLLLGLEYLKSHRNRLLTGYLVFGVVLALATVSKEGSDAHYWLEPVLILSVLTAALVTEKAAKQESSAEVLCLLVVALFFARLFSRDAPQAADFIHDRAIQSYLRQTFPPGTPGLSHWTGDLVRAGMEVPFSDPDQLFYLVRRGILSDQILLDGIRGRRFGIIVSNQDMRGAQSAKVYALRRTWQEAILSNYSLATSLEMPRPEKIYPDDRFFVWVPRPLGESAAPDDRQPDKRVDK